MTEEDTRNLELKMNSLNITDKKDLEKMFWIPCIQELFFVDLGQDGFHRCKRIEGSKQDIRIKLIDIEEEVSFQEAGEFYVMPEKIKDVPSLAIKCKWNENNVTGCENFDKSAFLQSSIYQTFDFEVLNHQNEEKIVNIWKISKDDGDKQDEKALLSLFDEDHLNTENAMIAIQGFSTRDDDRRCMHYDAETRGCFKKGRCKLNHVPELEEGVYRDKKEIFYYNHFAQILPKVKVLYDIQITAFSSLNRFFCFFSDEMFYGGKSLKKLSKQLNDKMEVMKYQKLTCLPAAGELVIAKHENTFYRGKVMNLSDLNSCVAIFLVDEGSIIDSMHLNMLYEYCSRFSKYPFFAMELEVANIAPMPGNSEHERGIDLLMNMQKSCPFKALVM